MVVKELLCLGVGAVVGSVGVLGNVRATSEYPIPHRHPYRVREHEAKGEFKFTYYKVSAIGSFNHVASHLASCMKAMGCEVEVRDHHDHLRYFKHKAEWRNDFAIVHPLFHAERKALDYLEKCHRYILSYEVADTTQISSDYVEFANDERIDAIYLPSTFAIESYRRCGVMNRLILLPHGVSSLYRQDGGMTDNPTLTAIRNDGRIKVLVACLHSGYRKGWDVSLQVLKELRTRGYKFVAVVKAFPLMDHVMKRDLHEEAMPSYVVSEWLSEESMVHLYDSCDVLLYPYRGGAFELPVFEALARGLPAVVTGWGCVLDYVNVHNAYLISPTRLVKLFPTNLFGHVGMGADPDVHHAIELMRFVLDNLDYCKKKARALRGQFTAQSWDKAVDEYLLKGAKEVWETA